ncbi:MAG: NAD(P)/FAD-dependent oxidoreductase [Candidatus Symbiobacter sp.]|nr:NAD(P)/FAD-dependent oxidoreductase [Candidatus Symbiobacter sp.]
MSHSENITNAIPPNCDTIIIGGGHNGLVAANLLAQAGQKVHVFEASSHWGGAATSRAIAPDVTVNEVVTHLTEWPRLLSQKLRLGQSGLRYTAQSDAPHTVLLGASGGHLTLKNGQVTGENLSENDQNEWQNFTQAMRKFARVLAPILAESPPLLSGSLLSGSLLSKGGDFASKWAAAKLAVRLRLLGRRDMREFLRIIGMNGFDLAQDYLSHPMLQGLVALEATQSGYLGPRAPGTVLPFLLHLATQAMAASSLGSYQPYDRAVAQPVGGAASLSAALAAAAERAGVVLWPNSKVQKILIEDGQAIGIVLESGTRAMAKRVIATLPPKNLMLDLVGPTHLDGGFVHRMNGLTSRGRMAVMYLVVKSLPQFTGLDESALRSRLVIAPTAEMVEIAFDATKYGKCASASALAITLPSLSDPSLMVGGNHILAVQVVGAADARASQDTATAATQRNDLIAASLRQLEIYAPGIAGQILHQHIALPVDIEREYGLSGGAWHGVDVGFDRFYALRPSFDLADYATPIENLFATGAAFHPGGGVNGWPGHNLAQKILRIKGGK